jgi:polyisoprenoid-binding protein YceI
MNINRRLLIIVLGSLTCGLGSASFGQTGRSKGPVPPSRGTYQIDAKKSRFIVETETTGLSAMFAHDHKIGVRDFAGQATFARGNAKGASLNLTVQASSLYLMGEDDIGARQSIESALPEEVLEVAKYPEIVFKSRNVTTERRGDGTFDIRITGDLKLHGVTKQVVVPARVSLDNGTLHAIGVIELRQTDFKITPFSFVNGSVGIRDAVTLSFDIMATQPQT